MTNAIVTRMSFPPDGNPGIDHDIESAGNSCVQASDDLIMLLEPVRVKRAISMPYMKI